VALESELPGLREWRRVIDWRLSQLEKMGNASTYPGSQMDAEAILESGTAHVILATGSQWRRDGVGRTLWQPIPGHDSPHVFTPDDLMTDRLPSGRVVVFDDDHYYMGGVLAELLAGRDCEVTLVTSAPLISYWTQFTLEQERILHRLTSSSVTLYTQHLLNAIRPDAVTLSNMVSGTEVDLPCDGVVLVTDRLPNDALVRALKPAVEEKKLSSLRVIGDAEAPHIIAQAIYSGYLAACEFDEEPADGTPFRVERAALS
jgi:dimethylamine/trimethylamine dehydrogenase